MFAASRRPNQKSQVIASCIISFLLISLCNTIFELHPKWTLFTNMFGQVLVSSLISILFGFIFAIILRTKWFDKLCCALFGVSPHTDIFESALDVKEGANIRVFFKNHNNFNVYGHYAGRDIREKDEWLCITEPLIHDEDGNERQNPPDVSYLCRVSDIECIFVE